MNSITGKAILSLDVHSRSFGYAVFEGPDMLLDWGLRGFPRGVRAVRVPAARKLAEIIDDFSPKVIVFNDRLVYRTRRYSGLVRSIMREAEKRRIPVRSFKRKVVRNTFQTECNRYRIACQLTAKFPELAAKLPPRARRVQDREDTRMTIFDAVALGISYFRRYLQHSHSADAETPISSQAA